MNQEFLEQIVAYYNKFNEDKRLLSRHGQVEFTVSMVFIHKYLELIKEKNQNKNEPLSILDIGAGTGRYSVALSEEGYDVTAVELVRSNLGQLKKKNSNVKAYQGNALSLKRFDADCFDLTLLFGPMYHLHSFEDKCKALSEAKRVTKKGGIILVAYCMNDYSVISYAFKDGHILEALENGMLTEDFHCTEKANELYSMVRIEDIDAVNKEVGLERIQIIAPDGATDYMRNVINSLSQEAFEKYIDYQLKICERMDLIGASSHTVDILQV